MSYNSPPKFESNLLFSKTQPNLFSNTGTDFDNQIQIIGNIGVVEHSETLLQHGCLQALSCTPVA